MRIYALAEDKLLSPEGEITDLGYRTWREIGEQMRAHGATHVCVIADTTSPGGAGVLMPMGLMTIEEYAAQAARLG